MTKIIILSVLIVFALTLAGFISPVASSAEDKTCWFKASGSYDVYFIIREKTESMGDREYVMWKGWVKHYEKKHYVSSTGQVRYDYKTLLDDKLIGDNHADCKNGKVIHIP
jgi:hypothetical protein